MAAPWRLALLGDPVAHSLSPRMQAAALAAAGLDGTYEALPTTAAALSERLETLLRAGYRGLNLTAPLKEAAWRLLGAGGPVAAASADAAALGAVNTLVPAADGAAWTAHDTDLAGFSEAARAACGSLAGRRVALIGAGGAARAAALALAREGVAHLAIWNRGATGRGALAALVAGQVTVAQLAPVGERLPGGFDLVVQATSLGLAAGDPLPPLPAAGERPFALDLVTGATPWQDRCRAAGCSTADGRLMLLAQGAAAFALWTGRPAPREAMRRALGLDTAPPARTH
ncbi:MAG: shikimate dehydrogenase [Candidatus Krumholzibacteriota bacterium]|nr:shikimate dehydrogenase [Candidatus Krumholzibacteriota bacterium]